MNNYKITMENLRGDEVRDKPYGEGTAINPYKISNAENLVYFAEHEEMWTGKHFLQTNNIDMSSVDWGYNLSYIDDCNYNGNGFSISNLTIDIIGDDIRYIGLFGRTNNCVFFNITISNSSINTTNTGNSACIGFVTGHSQKSTFENITINSSEINVSDYSVNTVAGLVIGSISMGVVKKCKTIDSDIIIDYDYYYNFSGLLIGRTLLSNINECCSIGGTVESNICGGLIGQIDFAGGFEYIGTFVKDSYSQSNVNGINRAGGLIGTMQYGSIENCFSSSIVNHGTDYHGGLVGRASTSQASIAINSFWDTDVSTHITSALGTGKTTVELSTQSTFTDWDFTDIWEMGAFYPKLRFESFIIEKETELSEYPFPYKILKGTTQYDPFSYISYDYMISTSRKAEFQAFIDDYFDDENFNFVNTLTRVGYRKDLYDNDITLYNHFYYSTEDDEDEFVRIELEDNTIKYDVGSTVVDKYGETRTVSSREIVSEGISTIMCRIYEITDSGERIVYSGLIDKRETKFDGKKLSVSLIDVMGLYVELAEKYTKTINDIGDSGFDMVDTVSSIKQFVSFLKENININNAYLPDIDKIAPNINEDESIDYNYNEYFSERNNTMREFFVVETAYSNDINASFHLFLDASVDSQTGELSLAVRNLSSISSNYDISFNLSNATNISTMFFNPSGLKLNLPTYPTNYYFTSYTMGFRRKNYPIVFNLFCQYISGKIYVYVNFAMLSDAEEIPYYGSPQEIAFLSPYFETSEVNETYTKYLLIEDSISPLDYGVTLSDYSNLYNYVIDIIGNNIDEINTKIGLFTNDFNNMLNGNLAFLAISDTQEYVFDETDDNKIVSIFEEIDDEYKYLMKVETSKRLNNGVTFGDGQFSSTYNVYKQNLTKLDIPLVYNNTYREILPLYTGSSSLYDITKLFSLTCYNKILTKDTGEMYFDKESYSENNGYIYIDKADIINNYIQESMISDEESFDILDSVYVGTKYIKEAYKRLETSTKENYKKLYENNNMKVSFNLRNYEYEIKSNLTIIIDTREIEPKDVIRIMNNGYVKIEVFVTSVKFINNNTEIQIEGITMPIRTASLQ